MEQAILELLTRRFLEEREPLTILAWQGGEPTLAGLGFYQQALVFQQRFAAAGQQVLNTFQTNGLLLDAEWAAFLARHHFLIGLSLDGPAHCHDALRVAADGGGTHARAVAAWRLLQEHGCETNILTVVHRHNCDRGAEVYHYLTRELGAAYLQFIPCIAADTPEATSGFALRPGDYGRFLAEVFALWYAERARAVSVKLFDDLVLFLAGRPMRDCMHCEPCQSHLVVERDGSVYPCDFFVQPELCLGSICENRPSGLIARATELGFVARKARERPAECAACRHLDICQGGCPQFWSTGEGGARTQSLCQDMRDFLDLCRGRMEEMAGALRARWGETRSRP
jgi:uncharacterized protein